MEKPKLDNKRMTRKLTAIWTALVLSVCLFTVPAYATGADPLTIVNNLSDFIFSCIKAIGIIILGWGVVQVGMSIQSHDASQRSQGLPLLVWWSGHCFCQGDFDRHRCGVNITEEIRFTMKLIFSTNVRVEVCAANIFFKNCN